MRKHGVPVLSPILLLGWFCSLIHAQDAPQLQTAGVGPPVVAEMGDDGTQRLTIAMDSYEYRPNSIAVQVGKPVELTFISETILIPHNFILQDPSSGIDIQQEVGAGDTASVTFTPTSSGTFTFFCDKQLLFFPSHREEGMEGRMEVRE